MYFSGDREIFEYDAAGIQGYLAKRQELPFLESLLSFQELDLDELTPILRHICDRWDRFFETGDRQCSTDSMAELGALAAELLPIDELRRLPDQLVL